VVVQGDVGRKKKGEQGLEGVSGSRVGRPKRRLEGERSSASRKKRPKTLLAPFFCLQELFLFSVFENFEFKQRFENREV
jgi:hypothetical protein